MNALLGGLLEEDRSIRFKVILALEEMARRFTDLKVDREMIESAIISDVMLYFRRFAIFLPFLATGRIAGRTRIAPAPSAHGQHGARERESPVAAFPGLSCLKIFGVYGLP